MSKTESLATLAGVGVVVFGLMQLVRPSIAVKTPGTEVQVSPEVHRVLEKGCYSCHSNEKRLAWFDQVEPAYWLAHEDIEHARMHLNFSTLGAKPVGAQKASLYEAVNMVQLGAMPLPRYIKLHPEAKLSAADVQVIKDYLKPWSTEPGAYVEAAGASVTPKESAVEWNGLAYDGSFPGWKLLSVTDRGDNNTFRFILGNDVAVEAARKGQTKPWPDGARFAKVAWQQAKAADGRIVPGAFVQVELMVKGAEQYKKTEGWGFGRWRGAAMKPYGTDASFVNECTACHQPMVKADYVYTPALSQATEMQDGALNGMASAMPTELWTKVQTGRPETMFVEQAANHGAGTISVLFAEDGGELVLVTWGEREDPHWFGGRIPGAVQRVEVVGAGGGYTQFAGTGLGAVTVEARVVEERSEFIKGLVVAPMMGR